ncbi:hypothetical protein HYY75_03930, partial [bacterium]|nr:hypothetical protein [bacterium]
EQINQTRPVHILVIEDPIEFYFETKKARISQRQFRKDVFSVEQGINFAKKMDVDVLAIGDIKRDVPYKAILDYADGDNLVFLTMQTLGIQNTLEKILSAFPKADHDHACNLIASNLIGVCSQTLILNPGDDRMVPVHEILVLNNTIKGIIQKGRISQIDPNIRTAGEGSFLFETELGTLVREGKVSKEASEGFLAMYRGMKG